MTAEIVVQPRGLQTDPSEILVTGGGLVTASNVLCRRPGIIEPRGGFAIDADPTISTYVQTSHLAQFGSGWVSVLGDGSSVSALTLDLDSANALALSQANLSARSGIVADSLALVLDGGIRMMDTQGTDPNTGANRFMGVPRPDGWKAALTSLASSKDWLADNYATAYRIVHTRRINNRLYRSAPSDRRVVYNDTGANSAVAHYLPVTSAMLGWEIQIYRSVSVIAYTSAAAQPTDEMRLRATVTVTASHVSAGYATFTDCAADADWSGASLYTNGTQEGIKLSNYAPGTARDVASYNGMTFLGAHRTGHRLTLGVQAMGDINEPQTSLVSVKFAATSGTGSPTLTGVTAAAFNYFAVGQIVTLATNTTPGSADATFLANAKITTINSGAGTITLDKNAGTTGAITAIAWDWIKCAGTNSSTTVYAGWVDKVGATTINLNNYGGTASRTTNGVFCVTDDGTQTGITAGVHDIERAFGSLSPTTSSSVLIRCWSAGGPTQPNRGGSITFAGVVVSDSGGQTVLGTDDAFTVTSTKPQAFDRYVDSVTGITSARDGGDNVLAWSKLGELEAFPLGYYTTIGTGSNVIYRVAACDDSLFVFSAQGIYRVYGVSPSDLSVTQWDPTARMSESMAGMVTRYGNVLYTWTQRGIAAVSAGGVQNIDDPIANTIRGYQVNVLLGSGMTYSYAGTDEQCGLVVFGAVTQPVGATPFTLVYSTHSGTWTTFGSYIGGTATYLISAAARASDGYLKVGLSGVAGYAAYFEAPYYDSTPGGLYPLRADVIRTNNGYSLPTLSAASGSTATTTTGSAIIPLAVGDAIGDNAGTFRYVTNVNGSTITFSGAVTNGVVQAVFKAYECSWTYAATSVDQPLLEKRFHEMTLNFGLLRYGRSYTINDSLWDSTSATSQTVTYDSALNTYTTNPKAMATRRAVPTATGRGIGLRTNVNCKQACAYFAAGALSVTYDPVTTKVNRGQS